MIIFPLENLDEGGIFIKNNFLDKNEYDSLLKIINKLKYEPKYQPSDMYFGNRFQAYPCYENNENDSKINEFFLPKFEKYFNRKLKDVNFIVRKILTEEIIKSKCNTPLGFVHFDNKNYAALLYTDHTSSGGTAFFGYDFDKHPDIVIGAYPNRLIAYSGKRLHAPMHDFTYNERIIIAYFFN